MPINIGKDCFVSFLCLFLENSEVRPRKGGTVRFRRAILKCVDRLTLRPTYKVAPDQRVYMWAMGTAIVFKYRNAAMRGIK